MKMPLVIALVCLSASVTFASVKTYRCRNEAHSALTASLTMTKSIVKIKFGSGSDGGNLEQDLKNKSLSLVLDADSSHNGWLGFTGVILVNSTSADYRTVELRVASTSLEMKSPIKMTFQLSDTHTKNQSPLSAYDYGMICQ